MQNVCHWSMTWRAIFGRPSVEEVEAPLMARLGAVGVSDHDLLFSKEDTTKAGGGASMLGGGGGAGGAG